jgi:hypothetical protein
MLIIQHLFDKNIETYKIDVVNSSSVVENVHWTCSASSNTARKFLTIENIFARNFCHIIYLYCSKIPKAFCKSRLSCAEIEVYHTVLHHACSEIYICRTFLFSDFDARKGNIFSRPAATDSYCKKISNFASCCVQNILIIYSTRGKQNKILTAQRSFLIGFQNINESAIV